MWRAAARRWAGDRRAARVVEGVFVSKGLSRIYRRFIRRFIRSLGNAREPSLTRPVGISNRQPNSADVCGKGRCWVVRIRDRLQVLT